MIKHTFQSNSANYKDTVKIDRMTDTKKLEKTTWFWNLSVFIFHSDLRELDLRYRTETILTLIEILKIQNQCNFVTLCKSHTIINLENRARRRRLAISIRYMNQRPRGCCRARDHPAVGTIESPPSYLLVLYSSLSRYYTLKSYLRKQVENCT